jgi:error-prone DNA polymerase
MKGNMIAPYLDGRHGFAKAEYLHPDLRPILQETFGVVIFHEHVLRIFDKMTGCGLAKADEFRRSLENPRVAQSVERYFKTQANIRGYDRETVEKVWAILAGFSSFGFCKAHGAAFALPTYQSAWLKTHYPTEFLAGLLTHDPGMYPRRLLLAEARRLGVKVLPIDVNLSTNEFLVQPAPKITTDPNEPLYGVRMALTDVKAITEPEVQRIIQEQPFQDIADFYVRAKPSRRTLQNLALVGALDELARVSGHHRGDIMQRVKELNLLKSRPKDDPNQFSFDFELKEYLQSTEDLTREEKLEAELSILKMDVTEHQLEQFRPMLDAMGVINSNELVGLRNKSEALIAGVRIATQTPPMRSGKRVVFVSLDDGHGVADATFFDEAQARASHILFNNRLLLIAGKTRRTGVNGISLMAENAWDLRTLWDQWVKEQKAS